MSDLSDDAILIVTVGRFREIVGDLLRSEHDRTVNERHKRALEKWRATNTVLN